MNVESQSSFDRSSKPHVPNMHYHILHHSQVASNPMSPLRELMNTGAGGSYTGPSAPDQFSAQSQSIYPETNTSFDTALVDFGMDSTVMPPGIDLSNMMFMDWTGNRDYASENSFRADIHTSAWNSNF
jgi:hypothetical protein